MGSIGDATGITEFSALSARANSLSSDRIDVQFVAKEVCRFMSLQTETSAAALRRAGRYFLGHQRMVYMYPWQRAEGIDVYSDTGWSGKSHDQDSVLHAVVGNYLLR